MAPSPCDESDLIKYTRRAEVQTRRGKLRARCWPVNQHPYPPSITLKLQERTVGVGGAGTATRRSLAGHRQAADTGGCVMGPTWLTCLSTSRIAAGTALQGSSLLVRRVLDILAVTVPSEDPSWSKPLAVSGYQVRNLVSCTIAYERCLCV